MRYIKTQRRLYIPKDKCHIVKRYVQRFKKDNKLLSLIKKPDFARSFQENKLVNNLLVEMADLFDECKETKCYMNNTKGLLYIYDKHGFHDYHFFHNYDIIFITKRENGHYHGVTCFSLKGDNKLFQNISHIKYKNKNKEEE